MSVSNFIQKSFFLCSTASFAILLSSCQSTSHVYNSKTVPLPKPTHTPPNLSEVNQNQLTQAYINSEDADEPEDPETEAVIEAEAGKYITAYTWSIHERGVASWYGSGFYYKPTASGEIFRPGPYYTAAHRTLPLGTIVIVRNMLNARTVLVRINDRGPFIKNRVIDLSKAAARKLGIIKNGTATVEIYIRKPLLAQD